MIEMVLARMVTLAPPDPAIWCAECWRIDRFDGGWRIGALGWAACDRRERLERLRAILAEAARDPSVERLDWIASGVSLDRTALVASDARWRETGTAPLLDLVTLELDARDGRGRCGVATKGLAIITGREVEAVWAGDGLKDQATLVARTASYLLSDDPGDVSGVKDQFGRVRAIERRERGYFTANAVLSFDLPAID